MARTGHRPNSIPFKQPSMELAYRAIAAELQALEGCPLTPVNIDVGPAVLTVLACWPEIRALRPAIEKELPNFDLSQFDKLEQYALALGHVHALYRNAVAPNTNMAAQAAQLTVTRDRLYQAALTLAEFGLVQAERLRQCKTAIGYRALVNDVLTLVAVYRDHWSEVAESTPVTVPMLDEASSRATEFLEAVALKEQAPLTAAEAALQRSRAFTLLARAYDDARRAVAYLRADFGDADKIAPSLYAGRGGRPRSVHAAKRSAAATPAGASTPNGSGKSEAEGRAGRALTSPLTH